MKKAPIPVQRILRCHKRGGHRKGAGQKKTRVNEPSHARRKVINFRKPMHITIRLAPNKPSLREKRMQLAFLRAIGKAKARGLAVQHYALVGNHAHFMVETEDNRSLARGMMSLTKTLSWAVRKIFNIGGSLFAGRFHTQILDTPTQVRNAMRYVLFNFSKHENVKPYGDIFSSIFCFREIEKLMPGDRIHLVKSPPWMSQLSEALTPARSWLQTTGWKRARV